MDEKNWIVVTGQPVDTAKGGGFEFFGPYTEEEALALRERWIKHRKTEFGTVIILAVQLLFVPASSDA